jgi:DnaK suppressor protein
MKTNVTKSKTKKAEPIKMLNETEKSQYSEKELIEFRDVIIEKLDAAIKNKEFLKSSLSRSDEHGTEDTSPAFKMMEGGADVDGKEEIALLVLRQDKFIQNLQNALIRIQNKTYGICRVTGKLIPKERLLSVPHTTLSIDAKLEQRFRMFV